MLKVVCVTNANWVAVIFNSNGKAYPADGPKKGEILTVIDSITNFETKGLYYEFKEYPPDEIGPRNFNSKNFKPVQDDHATEVLENINNQINQDQKKKHEQTS